MRALLAGFGLILASCGEDGSADKVEPYLAHEEVAGRCERDEGEEPCFGLGLVPVRTDLVDGGVGDGGLGAHHGEEAFFGVTDSGCVEGEGPWVVVMDKTSLNVAHPSVQTAAFALGEEPNFLTNQDLATTSGNPIFRWNESHPGSILTLPTGSLTDPGLFSVPDELTGDAGTFSLDAFVAGSVSQDQLSGVQGAMPVGPTELERMVGYRFVAIVLGRDAPYDPGAAKVDLRNPRLGKFYFTVLGLGSGVGAGPGGAGYREIILRVDAVSSAQAQPSAGLVAVGGCNETPRSCVENYLSLHSGPVPNACVRLTSNELGRTTPLSVGGVAVDIHAWTESTPGHYTAMAYTPMGGDILVSGATGSLESIDDGDGIWVHPGGPGVQDALQSMMLCACTVGEPVSGVTAARCGDEVTHPGEACDDGNNLDGDGCSVSCLVEAGWTCSDVGCFASSCGDGIVAGYEECEDDDATPTSGDGCSDRCRIEDGYSCPTVGQACGFAACGNGVREGTEACDDGNTIENDGCSPICRAEPVCPKGGCFNQCGDGLLLPSEACDDGNARSGDGCSDTCRIEPGFVCTTVDLADQPSIEIPILYRDLLGRDRAGGHPDFQRGGPFRQSQGLLMDSLDADGLPIFNPSGRGDIISAESFSTWYRDSDFSLTVPGRLRLERVRAGVFVFDSRSFFPLEGPCPTVDYFKPCGRTTLGEEPTRTANDGQQHNFHFTSIVRTFFEYQGGEKLNFRGDDDVWVFINDELVVDIGGVHGPISGSVTLSQGVANKIGLTLGHFYGIDVFQAERHTSGSNYRLTLSGFSREVSQCRNVCGDRIVTPDERCDDGTNDGGYGGCSADCQSLGPLCGDGVVDADYETCDDGNADDGDGCSSTCLLELACPFLDTSVCDSGPCADDSASAECRRAMRGYCTDFFSDPACRYRTCRSGQNTLDQCKESVVICPVRPADSICRLE